jgi:hypothetical protein
VSSLGGPKDGGIESNNKTETENTEEILKKLKDDIDSVITSIDTLGREKSNNISRTRQLQSELTSFTKSRDAVAREVAIKRKTLEMLPQAKINIQKLEAICGASSQRFLQLVSEWETHRKPLISKLKNIKSG